jgi:hypothetical protein
VLGQHHQHPIALDDASVKKAMRQAIGTLRQFAYRVCPVLEAAQYVVRMVARPLVEKVANRAVGQRSAWQGDLHMVLSRSHDDFKSKGAQPIGSGT